MLEERTKKLMNEVAELCAMQASFIIDALGGNSDEAKAMRKTMEVYTSSMNLVMEYSRTVDDINKKLDKILEKMEDEA